MSLNTAKFNPNGGKLSAGIDMKGICAASYILKLSESNSNQKITEWSGDNQNSEDDVFDLPAPVNENNGRMLWLTCLLSPFAEGSNTAFTVQLTVFQDNKIIGTVKESGTFSTMTVTSQLFIKLVSN